MKTKKLLFLTLLTALCVCVGIFAAACSEVLYAVTFDMQGHGTAPQTVTGLSEGDKVQKPDDPTEEGYVFLGWYKDAELGEEWNFETDTVKSDTVIYAGWRKKENYTVSFDVKGHGTAPQQLTLVEGSKLQKPEDPFTDGYVFSGWYKDTECTKRWDFYADSVNENTVLYARWKEIFEVDATGFTANVKDVEYFNVEHRGSYTVTIKKPKDINGFDFRLNDELQLVDFTYSDYWSNAYYFEEGVHKLSTVIEEFNAKVSLTALSTPFTEVEQYEGDFYKLNVSEAGDIPALRFGESKVDIAQAIAFDGEYYTLSVRELVGSVYDYYNVKIKINFSGSRAVTIEVYTQDGGVWGQTPADVLEKARTAAEITKNLNASDAGELNSADIERGFAYAYFYLGDFSGQWLEFSGFAEGTEFYFCDISEGAKGQPKNLLNIEDGKAIKLSDDKYYGYLKYIVVKPASGSAVSFTVKTVEEPAPEPGSSEENPITLTLGEEYSSECEREVPYYFVFSVADAGKYKISVYWDYYGKKSAVSKCVLDGVTEPWLIPPAPEKFLEGVEKEFEAGSAHTLAVTSKANNMIVKVEKVEEQVAGAFKSGTYQGSTPNGPFTLEFKMVFDGSANTVAVSMNRLLGENSLGLSESEATAYTDNGDGSYSVKVLMGSNGYQNYTITVSEDGNTLNVTGDYAFTAEFQPPKPE